MKISLPLLLTLIGALLASGFARADDRALPNPFGVFALPPYGKLPAAEQVALAQAAGYDGLMVKAGGKSTLDELRAFAAVPAVHAGKFRIYSILWQHHVDKPLDLDVLQQYVTGAKALNAALWINTVGTPGEREKTVAILRTIAAACQAGGAQLVLYPHHNCTFETAEESLEIWEKLKHPEIQLSLHLCHEMKAKNLDRIDAIVAKILPHLTLVSLNGADTSVPLLSKGWDGIIIPLHEGDFDVRPFVGAVARHGYKGPILLHNFGFKSKPEEYLPASMKRWREISADVARQIAAETAAKKLKSE